MTPPDWGPRVPLLRDVQLHPKWSVVVDAFAEEGAKLKRVHLAGHSTGGILMAHLLEALGGIEGAPRIRTCLLMAPACTHDIFNEIYKPLLRQRSEGEFGVDQMRIYNLSEKLEKDDTVTPVYRKSLLYLVSRAFEEELGDRILGMQTFHRYLRNLPGGQVLRFHVSEGPGRNKPTTSKTHGGFDNDVATMNNLLSSILRTKNLTREFTASDLDY